MTCGILYDQSQFQHQLVQQCQCQHAHSMQCPNYPLMCHALPNLLLPYLVYAHSLFFFTPWSLSSNKFSVKFQLHLLVSSLTISQLAFYFPCLLDSRLGKFPTCQYKLVVTSFVVRVYALVPHESSFPWRYSVVCPSLSILVLLLSPIFVPVQLLYFSIHLCIISWFEFGI